MRKQDIRPGVVYAYQRFSAHPSGTVEPLMFLSFTDYGKGLVLDSLWQDMRGTGERAFRPARPGRKVQAGRAANDGNIGYPAVLLAHPPKPTSEQLDALRAVTFAGFRAASRAWFDNEYLFLVVTSLRRVTGEWEV